MVRVSFYEDSDEIILRASGHAAYAEKGQDIVCAGVSALCLMLKLASERIASDSEKSSLFFMVDDGMFFAGASNISRLLCGNDIKTLFRACFDGLQGIERLYPRNVRTHKLLVPFGIK